MNFQLYNTSNFSQVTGLTPRGSPPAQELTLTYNVPVTGGSGTQTTQQLTEYHIWYQCGAAPPPACPVSTSNTLTIVPPQGVGDDDAIGAGTQIKVGE
jgi:hypothetical protein